GPANTPAPGAPGNPVTQPLTQPGVMQPGQANSTVTQQMQYGVNPNAAPQQQNVPYMAMPPQGSGASRTMIR
ncbi:MAG: hypothetical protein FWH27_19525, partial [Planctomycetaceae bacterium]|nr:hypothetical protein [Planctomycetaceae bacterium]